MDMFVKTEVVDLVSQPIQDGKRTVRRILVQAAEVLQAKTGATEFSEWELTVQAWKLYPRLVGMPGFETQYPDHKRTYCELIKMEKMAGLYDPYLKRVRANTYALCPPRKIIQAVKGGNDLPHLITDLIRRVGQSAAFYQWKENPEYPKDLSVVRPLKFADYKEVEYAKDMIASAVANSGPDFPVAVAADVHDFLTVIQHRFYPEIENAELHVHH